MSEDVWKDVAVVLAKALERQVPVVDVETLLAQRAGKDPETVARELARLIKAVDIAQAATSDLQGQLAGPEAEFAAKQAVRSAIRLIEEAPGD